ncbi:MAG TPA: trehalose-6-phosphate synthase, partial [candidate division Zixibacteria bacterium]
MKFDKFIGKIKQAGDAAIKKALLKSGRNMPSHQNLIDLIRKKLSISKFMIVSNREPYVHFYEGDTIRHIRYASGLTIALDSIARTSKGIWVAHGSGDADMDTADDKGRIMVPPEEPQYTLKRIQLSKEEDNGYYYGFSNQVLWPLCHVAYVRPKFELEYWNYYQKVNQLFARAVIE